MSVFSVDLDANGITFTGGAKGIAAADLDAPVEAIDTAIGDFFNAVDITDVAAATAVLVADGASPTQAHVTDLDDALTAYSAAYDAAQTDLETANTALADAISAIQLAADGALSLTIDETVLDTKAKVLNALRAVQVILRSNSKIDQ